MKIIEINKTIDFGHRNLETGTTSRVVSPGRFLSHILTILFDKYIFIVCIK